MKPDPDQDLALQVDRALKALPELPAPAALSQRVMAAIHARTALPWHRQAWSTWPAWAQTVAFLLLAGLFAGICLAAYKLPEVAAVAALQHQVSAWFAVLNAGWAAVGALGTAVSHAVSHCGTALLTGCIVALVFAYLMCMGLGTVYVRLALARR